jgi:hypothetical protein
MLVGEGVGHNPTIYVTFTFAKEKKLNILLHH